MISIEFVLQRSVGKGRDLNPVSLHLPISMLMKAPESSVSFSPASARSWDNSGDQGTLQSRDSNLNRMYERTYSVGLVLLGGVVCQVPVDCTGN